MKIKLVYILLMVLLTACVSDMPQAKLSKHHVKEQETKNIDRKKDLKPLWIDNPFMNGYVVGVGSSNNTNMMMKKRIAIAKARANLAEAIRVEIKTHLNITTKTTKNSTIEFSEQIIEQNANELLVGSEVEDTYQDNNGNYFVFVILNKKEIRLIEGKN